MDSLNFVEAKQAVKGKQDKATIERAVQSIRRECLNILMEEAEKILQEDTSLRREVARNLESTNGDDGSNPWLWKRRSRPHNLGDVLQAGGGRGALSCFPTARARTTYPAGSSPPAYSVSS